VLSISRLVPLLDRITSECVMADPARYRTPRSSSPSVMPVATKNALSPRTRSSVDSTALRSRPASMAFCFSSSSVGHSRPWILPPMHLIAQAVMIPSGVPPTPISRSTPVPSVAAMIAPATSPSVRNLIRAPVARISSASCWCRSRSSITTVTSWMSEFFALATRRMFSDTGSRMSTTSAASGPVTSLSM
jgi:hypothetical protein